VAARRPTIVVGIDGSEASLAALRWAVAEAELRGDEVRAVYAWRRPLTTGFGHAPTPLHVPAEKLREEAESRLASFVSEIARDAAGVHVGQVAEEGVPADVLVGASRDADLLVLGSRGLGRVGAALLGSVSRRCAREAACSVVIVRRR